MKENKIVYGLIGFGGMGKWHTEILENVPEIELAGIYDIKEEKENLQKKQDFIHMKTEEAMLADESIDVILVATPNDTHRPIALRAMEAGKNVIVEKPATLSLKELTELEDMAGKTGQFLTVHQNRRWDEDLLTVRGDTEGSDDGRDFPHREPGTWIPWNTGRLEKRKSTRRRNGAGLGRPPL